MRYTCPYCERKHWLYSTMKVCRELWFIKMERAGGLSG